MRYLMIDEALLSTYFEGSTTLAFKVDFISLRTYLKKLQLFFSLPLSKDSISCSLDFATLELLPPESAGVGPPLAPWTRRIAS